MEQCTAEYKQTSAQLCGTACMSYQESGRRARLDSQECSNLRVNVPDPVPITAQSKLPQIDPLENLIEQLRTELVFLRSQVSYPPNNIPRTFF